jgi:hypothetical protein
MHRTTSYLEHAHPSPVPAIPASKSGPGPLSQLALASKLHLLDLKDLLRVKVLAEPADEDEGLGLVVWILFRVGTQWAVQVGMQAL